MQYKKRDFCHIQSYPRMAWSPSLPHYRGLSGSGWTAPWWGLNHCQSYRYLVPTSNALLSAPKCPSEQLHTLLSTHTSLFLHLLFLSPSSGNCQGLCQVVHQGTVQDWWACREAGGRTLRARVGLPGFGPWLSHVLCVHGEVIKEVIKSLIYCAINRIILKWRLFQN